MGRSNPRRSSTVPDYLIRRVELAHQTKIVAFHLPQFHRIPENDAWWGEGFTEWTNVARAEPQFAGHYQPHVPADLGYYDLTVRADRMAQAELAQSYGIDAFCFHYYWFSGKRLLERPIEAILSDPDHTMPFCLCWANENWTRRWDGADHDVLIAQGYTPEDPAAFAADVTRYMRDDRYLRAGGKPILVVYTPQAIPDTARVVEEWRTHFRATVGEVYLIAALTQGNMRFREFGFDAGVQFPPHNARIDNVSATIPFRHDFRGAVLEYGPFAESLQDATYPDAPVHRCVVPAWDNSARIRDKALMLVDGTPDNYERWLSRAVAFTRENFAPDNQLVFVNAWNEWAEGCHLEPDQRHGRGFLEATRRVAEGTSRSGPTYGRSECAALQRSPALRSPAMMLRLAHMGMRNFTNRLLASSPGIRRAVARVYNQFFPR